MIIFEFHKDQRKPNFLYDLKLLLQPFLRLLLIIVALLPSVSASAKVYVALEKDEIRPWQSCYTGPVSAAKGDLLAKRFSGGNDAEVRGLTVSGEGLRFDLFVFGERYRNIDLQPCMFTDADLTNTVSCKLTIQDRGACSLADIIPARIAGGYLPAIEKTWKDKGFEGEIIDCKNKRARVIRNSWAQDLSIAEIKIMSTIVSKYRRPLIASAVGSVREGGSLDPMQGWSGLVHLILMENMESAEAYDASVQQFSVPDELKSWITSMAGSWAPWGLQIVSFECAGFPALVDPSALEWVPLDMNSDDVRTYCAGRRTKRVQLGPRKTF